MATESVTESSSSYPSGRLVECPQCGSKLPDIPVSLCPYCASPLETAAAGGLMSLVGAFLAGSGGDEGIGAGLMALGPILLILIGVGLLGLALWLRSKGKTQQEAAVARPLLKRAALIVDRRSETEISGWTGRTTYYFTVEFEDGGVGEFRFPGLGAQEDPYATNLPGVAYTRGADLLLFRHIRV